MQLATYTANLALAVTSTATTPPYTLLGKLVSWFVPAFALFAVAAAMVVVFAALFSLAFTVTWWCISPVLVRLSLVTPAARDVVSAPTSAPAPASEDRSPAPLCIEHRESSPTIETADWEPDFVQQFKRWCKTFGISGKDFVDAMTDEVNYQVTGQLFRRLLRHRQTSTTLFSEGKVRLLGTRITNEGIIAPNLWAIRHPSTAAGQLISLVGRLDGPIHQVAGNVKEATFHLLQGVSIPLRIEEGSSLYSDVGVNDRTSSFIHLKAVTRDRKNLLQLVFTGTSAFEVIETHGGCSWEAIANFNSALNFFSAAKTPTARLEAESGGVVLNHGTNVAAEAFWHQFGLSRT